MYLLKLRQSLYGLQIFQLSIFYAEDKINKILLFQGDFDSGRRDQKGEHGPRGPPGPVGPKGN